MNSTIQIGSVLTGNGGNNDRACVSGSGSRSVPSGCPVVGEQVNIVS